MTNFADQNGLIAGLVNKANITQFQKVAATAEGAGTFLSLWKVAGYPGAGANPPLFSAGAGYVPNRLTLGAYPFINSPGGGITNRVALFRNLFGAVGSIILYDRLWACSGFGTVVTTAQNVVTPGTLPADRDPTLGADAHPYVEVYTPPGATASTWTLTGTDAAGNTGRTWTYAHPANAETVGQMMPMIPGTAATLGCRQPTSFQCLLSSGTAGDVGITLVRRISSAGVALANTDALLDAYRTGLPQVFDDACLAFMQFCTGTSSGINIGDLVIASN
jgi:hypothetical protein